MKRFAILAAFGVCLASPLAAQQINSGAQSGSASTAYSGIVQNSHGSREQALRTAPAVVAPGMSSGHPCAYAPASASLSVLGGGASAGGQVIDDACLLGQMGEKEAALGMIAARNSSACQQLRRAGRIGANSLCTDEEKRAAQKQARVSTRGTPPIVCEKGMRGGKPVMLARYKPGLATPEEAAAYCKR